MIVHLHNNSIWDPSKNAAVTEISYGFVKKVTIPALA